MANQRSTAGVPTPSIYQIDGEDKEIVTHINVPSEGGWGWVVVASSFLSIFVVDGVVFTFGALFGDIKDDLKVAESLVALINSVAFAVYFMSGPIASAIINRFGFRECAMSGSVICCISLLLTYFARTYLMVLIYYGVLFGFGASLINLPSCLIVGFYFERFRALALAISLTGSSFGCMIMFPVNNNLVRLLGWRVTTLIHTAMLSLLFFIVMTFKPLAPILVTATATSSVAVTAPNVADENVKQRAQRLFNAVSNINFPTTADVVQQGVLTELASAKPGKSDGNIMPKYTLSSINPNINERQIKKMLSVVNQPGQPRVPVDVTVDVAPRPKRSFFARLCHWQKTAPESRPMYRDDIFYSGRVKDLDVYKKSVIDMASKDRFAIEYHMAVTRAAEVDDVTEKGVVCSIAVRRILATMIDPKLLVMGSFLMICTSAFFGCMGLLVPYVFLKDRNVLEGLDPADSSNIMSFMGLSNVIGKLIMGALACKIAPIKLYVFDIVITGAAAMAFNFMFTLSYQYMAAGIFGFFNAGLTGLRSLIIVNSYGLENLTNATGLMYIFQGVGCLISTPLSMIIKNNFGYAMSFYASGFFLIISGICLIPLQRIRNRETSKELENKASNKNEQKVAPVNILSKPADKSSTTLKIATPPTNKMNLSGK